MEDEKKISNTEQSPESPQSPVPVSDIDIEGTAESVLEHSDDEIFLAFMRRYGLIIAFVVIFVVGFVGFNTYSEDKAVKTKERVTAYMNAALKKNSDGLYKEAREGFKKVVDDLDAKPYAISLYAELLIIQSHHKEAQNELTKKNKGADEKLRAALETLESFIKKHQHETEGPRKEVLYFAYHCKSVIHEDLREKQKAIDASKQIALSSVVYKLTHAISGETAIDERDNIWKTFLKSPTQN